MSKKKRNAFEARFAFFVPVIKLELSFSEILIIINYVGNHLINGYFSSVYFLKIVFYKGNQT